MDINVNKGCIYLRFILQTGWNQNKKAILFTLLFPKSLEKTIASNILFHNIIETYYFEYD